MSFKKKINFKTIIIASLFLTTLYLIIEEITYSPLKKNEFDCIFKKYNKTKLKRKKIFFFLTIHGDRDDIYEYKVEKGVLNTNFPVLLKKWNEELIDEKSIVSGWRKCPIDSSTISLFLFMHRLKDGYGYRSHFFESNLLVDFRKAQDNSDNLYCYIITEKSYHFFIYCPKKNILYYYLFSI